ncbi:MAG: DinB family protein, partial [Nitrospiraceae bacterium]
MKDPTSLVRELAETRARTDALFAMIRPDSLYERPIPERYRLVFYLGHLEAFDWNLICRGELSMAPFQGDFDQLFAFGIDPPSGQLPNDKPSDWPPVAEVRKYNTRVRRALDEVLNGATDEVLHIAVEHRLMHAETF